MTELTALGVPMCNLRIPLPGFTPSLCSSLPCLASCHDASHSFLIFWQMAGLMVAVKIRSDSVTVYAWVLFRIVEHLLPYNMAAPELRWWHCPQGTSVVYC